MPSKTALKKVDSLWTPKTKTPPKNRIVMRFLGGCLLFVLNRQNLFRLPNRPERCILILSLHKFHLFRFVLKKISTKTVPARRLSFSVSTSQNFQYFFFFVEPLPIQFRHYFRYFFRYFFRRSVYGILRFCGGFYILIIAQKHCGYQEERLQLQDTPPY